MSDPDGMRATPSHQADVQELDNELWEAEGVLRIPPCVEGVEDAVAEEDERTVERGAVCMSRVQEKRHEGSTGSTAPASTPATRGPWSRTTSIVDWYPDEHPFIRSQRDTTDPDETPYSMMTSGFPLYKRSFMPAAMQQRDPIGFNANRGTNYINYPPATPPRSRLTTRRPSWPLTHWWWDSAETRTRYSANRCMPLQSTSSTASPPTSRRTSIILGPKLRGGT